MNIEEIKELMNAFENSGNSFLEIKDGDFKIKLKKNLTPVTVKSETTEIPVKEVKQEEIKKTDTVVKSPLVGIFYDSPNPDAGSYVKLGDRVEKGQVLCLIEAMKMMNEVTSPKAGVINKIYLSNQDVAEFEAPLFDIGD